MKIIPTSFLFLAAIVALPLRAAEPLRLAEVATVRFVERTPGAVWLQRGLFSALGGFKITDESPVLTTVTVPAEARDKMLIQIDAWFAYQRLGSEALINFIGNENVSYVVGARQYLPVTVNPDPKVSNGTLINISTRGRASTTDKLIGGFVVDEQHRWVLLRAVGAGLAAFGVTDAMADPYLTIYKGNTPVHFNGNWGTRPDAADIVNAGTRVGAFALATGSKDAALLVELPPGAYTAHVEPESGAAGQALLEIYIVPDNA